MTKKIATLSLLLSLFFAAHAQDSWQVNIMPQIAFGTNNDLQRPNNPSGTRFSLDRDFERKNDALFSPRIEVQYTTGRSHIIATAAWLKDRFGGAAPNDILYNSVLFNQGEWVDANYRFNTYRLGYRYRFVNKPRIKFDFGATILLRDAFISLESDAQRSKFSNVGVAPLLSYYFEWVATERLSAITYGDAFAVGVGRAEDIFAGARYQFSPLVSGTLGYRLLEGGSKGNNVYTMATFHFLSLGVGFNF